MALGVVFTWYLCEKHMTHRLSTPIGNDSENLSCHLACDQPSKLSEIANKSTNLDYFLYNAMQCNTIKFQLIRFKTMCEITALTNTQTYTNPLKKLSFFVTVLVLVM